MFFLHFCQITLFYACARNLLRTLNIGLHYEVFCFAYYKKQIYKQKSPKIGAFMYIYLSALLPFRHFVQTYFLEILPFSSATSTLCKFASNVRLPFLLEWLTVLPVIFPLPQMLQTFDIVFSSYQVSVAIVTQTLAFGNPF